LSWLKWKWQTKAAHCCVTKNIIGLEFGDLYRQKNQNKDIQNNSEFSALFYDSKKLLQIRIEGKAELITDKEQIATYWHTVQQASKKDYTTSIAPGIPIKNPEEVYNSNENYFCPVKLIPNTIEYLSLNRPNHLRVLFSRTDADWSGEF
jgi:pyridoxine/pyridoxamine 5'-phosphate oxidase